MSQPKQAIHFHALANKSLVEILKLDVPPFIDEEKVHRQLSSVEDYARQHGARSVVVENHHIDRDYMEDHGVFYSKNLFQYRNACRRVHFFSIHVAPLKRELKALRGYARQDIFSAKCTEFSKRSYLGFCVIKPLDGCLVGRTVLRSFDHNAGGQVDMFNCARDYEAHLLGVRLVIRGLAFQQQDLGVSAYATTALWTALQKARELEESGAATPAQITMRASQFALPFGRAMPSEGLSVDQMCQAVHALGYAPYLYRADQFADSRALLYSAVLSGISPVLILARPTSKHAVAVAGMGVRSPHRENCVAPLFDDRAGDILRLYVHDDRYGPYSPAKIQKRNTEMLIEIERRNSSPETSQLTHILIPMHPKIRLSFGGLRKTAIQLVKAVHWNRQNLLGLKPTVTSWEYRLRRAYTYVESLMRDDAVADASIEMLCSSIPFSRYLALVRIEASDLDPIDVILDTTSTQRNLNGLTVLKPKVSLQSTNAIAALLGAQYNCNTPNCESNRVRSVIKSWMHRL